MVVRIDGRRCGVKFRGQFHTQVNKPRKSLSNKAAPETASATKLAKQKAAAGTAKPAKGRGFLGFG